MNINSHIFWAHTMDEREHELSLLPISYTKWEFNDSYETNKVKITSCSMKFLIEFGIKFLLYTDTETISTYCRICNETIVSKQLIWGNNYTFCYDCYIAHKKYAKSTNLHNDSQHLEDTDSFDGDLLDVDK